MDNIVSILRIEDFFSSFVFFLFFYRDLKFFINIKFDYFTIKVAQLQNEFPSEIRHSKSFPIFKAELRKWFFVTVLVYIF